MKKNNASTLQSNVLCLKQKISIVHRNQKFNVLIFWFCDIDDTCEVWCLQTPFVAETCRENNKQNCHRTSSRLHTLVVSKRQNLEGLVVFAISLGTKINRSQDIVAYDMVIDHTSWTNPMCTPILHLFAFGVIFRSTPSKKVIASFSKRNVGYSTFVQKVKKCGQINIFVYVVDLD